jgi:hypothetical protein
MQATQYRFENDKGSTCSIESFKDTFTHRFGVTFVFSEVNSWHSTQGIVRVKRVNKGEPQGKTQFQKQE